ncbi:Rap guanine nucleotide exchange factor 4 [Thoreauomyces humboldtii]|nr:Rap guanine nucleotide exchange factor 4 [Thoreauomyces humboldtii]
MKRMMDQSTRSRTSSESILSADVLPEILAQQLCLYNSMLFRHIDGIEFIDMGWKKTSPALTFFISRFDKESYWVATEIVGKTDFKARVHALKTFILTAKECLDAQNYFTVFAIMFGLSLSPVRRLRKTWEGLTDKKKKVLAELEKVTDVSKNFKTYRDLLEVATPPLIPFLPIFIKDLTFINDGNENMLPNNRINFEKLRLLTDCVRGITSFAKSEYKWWNFHPDLQEYITNPPLEMSMTTLQEMSLACEPRAG